MIPNIKIGVLQDGRLINEVVIDKPSDVSIGTGIDNTVTISGNAPKTDKVLVYSKGKYYLKLSDNLPGKVFEGSTSYSIKQLASRPDLVKLGNSVYVPLASDVKGSLTYDNNTILFKVYPSISTPKLLPKEFRGGLLSDVDLGFFVLLVVFFFSYYLLISNFHKFAPAEKVQFEDVPERFARLILDKPIVIKQKEKKKEVTLKPKLKKKEVVKGAKKTGKKTKTTNTKVKKNVSGTKRRGGGRILNKKSAAELVRTAGIIGIIGSKGKGSGAVSNLFTEKGFGSKLDKALKGVSGLRAGRSLKSARMKRGGSSAKGIDIGQLKADTGAGAVAFGSKNVEAINVLGNIENEDVEGEGTIDPKKIAKTLAKHVGAFQYCYNRALRTNPRLSGEVKVRFTILESGKVDRTDMSYSGPASKDKSLTSCIFRVFRRIIFPKPKGGIVTVNYPLNFSAQN
jgi:hypothetical protein